MKSTRERILQTLLNNPRSTISDLANAVDINTISVRHHLTYLQAEGLIEAYEEKHGVGRPRLVYSLTESGAERFPTRYLNLTNRLLTQLKNLLPQKEVEIIFAQIAQELAAEQKLKIQNVGIEEKLDFIKASLASEGFVIEWNKVGEGYMINEISCPFYHVSQNHPEVCAIDQELISSILSVPLEKIQCVLNGDNQCSYLINQQFVEVK